MGDMISMSVEDAFAVFGAEPKEDIEVSDMTQDEAAEVIEAD